MEELGRRFSPRLHHNNVKVHSSTPIVASPESVVQETLSPKSPQCYPIESSPEPNVIVSSQTIQSSNILSSIRRRLSPRLHKDLAKPESPAVIADSEKIESPKILSRNPNFRRRFSPRLHREIVSDKIVESEELRLSSGLHSNGEKLKRKHKECTPQRRVSPRPSKESKENPSSNGCISEKRSNSGSSNDEPPPSEITGRSIHARVKKTLRIFNKYYLQYIQEEDERRMQSKIEEKNSNGFKSENKNVKQTAIRPDLKAVYKMKANKEILYPDKRIGHMPGIEVGYQFFSRAEMVVVGFHSQWLGGIDYIGRSAGKMNKHGQYTLPIAIAVVMSDQYDDLDNSDDIIYTGQGGHDLVGSKLQCADQVLLRGNLAMKNSMEQSVPVRVVRGHRNANSYSGNIYTYDGLYEVVKTLPDKGQRGHLVYKYHLKRIKGQPKLTTNQVQFVRGCSSKTFFELPGLVCHDISKGQEAICIPATNLYDDAYVDKGFTYIKTTEVTKSVNLPPSTAGCACNGNCTNPNTCACAKLNGCDFPYVRGNGGRLVEPKDVVFECGPNCSCGPGCINRTSQREIKYQLEVYRTPDKGWAVRSWDFIPSGAPVCEYIGILRRNDEVDNLSGNDYIFEIDCWHTMNEIEGRERRFGNVPATATCVWPRIDDKTLDSAPEFCIDAGSRGNVARFINHSCEPNLFVQCVLSAHHDLRLARLVFFAAENIPPMQELAYDYGYALDSVTDPDGKVKVLPCFCGTADCRKRLY